MIPAPESLVPFLVILPLLAGVAAYALPRAGFHAAFSIALLCAAIATTICFNVNNSGPFTHEAGGWSAPLGITLAVDGLAAFLLALLSWLFAATILYARFYFPAEFDERPFWSLTMLLKAALAALFLTRDVFNVYVCLELLGISAVGLAAVSGGKESLRAALRYLVLGMLGSLLYLFGCAILYGEHGVLDMDLLAGTLGESNATLLAFSLMTTGLLIKSALFPFHVWLPAAHTHAPAPVSALLSALVVKGGLYVLYRLWFEVLGDVTPPVSHVFGGLGVLAIVHGSVMALKQERLKMLVAYSTVAQIGYLFLLFPLGRSSQEGSTTLLGATALLASHALAKTAFFLSAGIVIKTSGSDRIDQIGPALKASPMVFFAVGMAGMALIGLPPSAGFIGKWLLIETALNSGGHNWIYAVAMVMGTLLTAAYIVRVLSAAFQKVENENDDIRPASAVMQIIVFTLAFAAAAGGLQTNVLVELLNPENTSFSVHP